jgi:hypothetical protein
MRDDGDGPAVTSQSGRIETKRVWQKGKIDGVWRLENLGRAEMLTWSEFDRRIMSRVFYRSYWSLKSSVCAQLFGR